MCMYSIGGLAKPKKGERKKERKFRGRKEQARRTITYMCDSLPSKWDEWANGFFDKIMFYEKLGNRSYKGYCECGECVELSQVRSGKKIKCPNCKKTVVLKEWKRKKTIEQRDYFAYIEPMAGDFVQRLFVGYKATDFNGTHTSYQLYMNEEERCYLYHDGDNYLFHESCYANKKWLVGPGRMHGMGWGAWRVSWQALHTYPYNLDRVFQNSIFAYSALAIAAKNSFVDPVRYLLREKKEPKLEMLYKVGLYRLAEQVYYDDGISGLHSVKSLKDLGIDRMDEVQECKALTYHELIARKEIKRWKIDESMRAAAMAFVQSLNKRCGTDFAYSFLSRQTFFKYWFTQREKYPDGSNFIRDYTDYIPDAKKLGLNITDTKISKPRDFKTMHDWVMNEIKVQETQVYDAQILAVYHSIKALCEWSDKKYAIVLPSTSREIVEEGAKQSHCVGRYCERVARGESVILFVRRKDNLSESWYTVEIKPDMDKLDIVQCRGYNNENKNAEEAAEIERVKEKYTEWFNRRSSGEYQSEIMATYYKAVRKKKGKYISNYDGKTEYKIGEEICAQTDKDPDKKAVKGLHIASLEFAKRFGDSWDDVAILEVQVNIHDVIVPDALDQVRASRLKVIREVPLLELGEFGRRHLEKQNAVA